MIARGDAIAGCAIGDSGARVLPGEWRGPVITVPRGPGEQRRKRRFNAHK